VLFVGCVAELGGTLARILDAQHGDERQHLRERVEAPRLGQHPAQLRVDRDPRQLPAQVRDPAVRRHRLQFLQQAVAVVHQPRVRRIGKGEFVHGAEPQRLHLQDHAGQVGPQDLRRRERLAGGEVLLGVETDAQSRADATAAALALVCARLGDGLDRQPEDLAARAVAPDPRQARIDHGAYAGHGDRRLGDVGGEHHAAAAPGLEDPLLVAPGEPREQRQDLQRRTERRGERLARLADFPFARQEHQHVAGRGRVAEALPGGGDDARHQARVEVVVLVRPEGPVSRLDRVAAARDLDHRRAAEESREALRVDGRRGHHHTQVRAPGQQAFQVTQEEIDVEAALVRLVDDQGVVAQQVRIGLDLGQQDAVGHHPDQRAVRPLLCKTDLEPDLPAERHTEFLRQPRCDTTRCNPARLRVPDQARQAPSGGEAGLR